MSRNSYLLNKYGITEDQYDALLQEQDGACAVCKRPAGVFKSRLAVDHDHHSGLIRGLLCTYCNRRVVGRHRIGSGAKLLLSAFEYLSKEERGWIVPPKKKRKKKRAKRMGLRQRRKKKKDD